MCDTRRQNSSVGVHDAKKEDGCGGKGGKGGGGDKDKYNSAATTHRVQPSFTTTLALLPIGSGGEGAGHDGGDVR